MIASRSFFAPVPRHRDRKCEHAPMRISASSCSRWVRCRSTGTERRLPGNVDPFKPYIEQRLQAGVRNAQVLPRELPQQGCRGGYNRYSPAFALDSAPVLA